MKKCAGELTNDRNHLNAELSAVVKYLAKLNDMCVAKPVPYRRGRRGVRLRLHDSKRLCPFCLRVHRRNSPDARFEVDESRHQGRSYQGCEHQCGECQRKQTRVTEFTPMKCLTTVS